MKLSLNLLKAATAILSCVAVPFCGFGATAAVSVVNFAFIPATTSIAPGDQVIWTWGNGFHSTTSSNTPALWDSGQQPTPFAFTNTFTSAGTFPYLCTVHHFTGNVIVQAPDLPPTVSITNPASGTVFIAPANVTVQASASDSDGTVTNVQFLVGAAVLTNEAVAPFSASTNNLTAGNYTLSVIASDNFGVEATNTIAITVVTPLPLVISAPQFLTAGFQLSYSANIGLNYIVQLSTNLTAPDWTTIFTNTATSNPVIFMDNHATNNPGFYRVGLLPNP